jgi:hypothetical protein
MTAPGWYNDEQDPRLARWHDGAGWTEHTMVKADWPGPGNPPPPGGTAAPAPLGPALGRPGPEPTETPWLEQPPVAKPRREGPSGHLVGAIASLVAVLVCLLILQRVEDDREARANAPTTTTTLPSSVHEWTTVDGSSYRISITPLRTQSTQPSPAGCLGAAEEGRANRQFSVRLENTSPTQSAPLPQVAFGVNLRSDGTFDPAITTLDGASTKVEIGPVAEGTPCSQARTIVEGSGEPLPPGGVREFTGVVGGVPAVAPDGLGVIVRWFAADETQVRRGTGFSPVDVVAAFPKGTTSSDEG